MSMGWEWRTFVPVVGDTLQGASREDIYFPCTPAVGLKLRCGSGDLGQLF